MQLDLEPGIWFGAPIPLALKFLDQSDQPASVLLPESIAVSARSGGGRNLVEGTASAQPAHAGQWPISGVRLLEDAGREVSAASPFRGTLECNATVKYQNSAGQEVRMALDGLSPFHVRCGVPHRIAIQGLEALHTSLETGQELPRDFSVKTFKATVFDKWGNVFVGSDSMQVQMAFNLGNCKFRAGQPRAVPVAETCDAMEFHNLCLDFPLERSSHCEGFLELSCSLIDSRRGARGGGAYGNCAVRVPFKVASDPLRPKARILKRKAWMPLTPPLFVDVCVPRSDLRLRVGSGLVRLEGATFAEGLTALNFRN